jgi:phospholipid transport system transporter-binding protein
MIFNRKQELLHGRLGSVKPSQEPNVLAVAGFLNFKNVVALRHQGKEWLQQPGTAEVAIDLREVENSDNSGLVLLVAWMRDAHAARKTLVFRHVPVFLQRMAQVFGLQSILFKT